MTSGGGIRAATDNILQHQADNVTLAVDDTGAGTACAHVNTDVVIYLDLDLVAGVSGGLPRRLA